MIKTSRYKGLFWVRFLAPEIDIIFGDGVGASLVPHATSQLIDLRHTLATGKHTCTVMQSIEAVVVSVSDSRNSSATVHLFYDECKHWTLQLSPLQTLCGLSLVCELPSLSVRAVRLSPDPSLPLFDVYWSCPPHWRASDQKYRGTLYDWCCFIHCAVDGETHFILTRDLQF